MNDFSQLCCSTRLHGGFGQCTCAFCVDHYSFILKNYGTNYTSVITGGCEADTTAAHITPAGLKNGDHSQLLQQLDSL